MNIEKLIELLEAEFPNAWFKDGGDFSNGTENSVWTGEGSYIGKGEDEVEMFDHYNMGENYQFGAHVKLCRFVESHGYWVECYDAGTYFIWPE